MGDDQTEEEIKVEIQKLLVSINSNMVKLNADLCSVHNLIEENASLPMTASLTNEKLIIAAKEAGIDLEDVETMFSLDNVKDKNQAASGTSGNKKTTTNKSKKTAMSNVEIVAAAADELTEKVKRTLKR